MLDLLDLFLQSHDLLSLHAFHDKHRKCSCSKFLHQDILSHHRLDIFRRVGEDIVIDPGPHIS